MNTRKVQVRTERVVLPTWEIGEPNPNPMFLEKRVYQGSSGAVYPYPVIDKIADRPGTMRDMGNTLCNNIGYTWAEF